MDRDIAIYHSPIVRILPFKRTSLSPAKSAFTDLVADPVSVAVGATLILSSNDKVISLVVLDKLIPAFLAILPREPSLDNEACYES